MVGQQEPVVTGDAVVLDVQIAQVPVRALSALIDITVVFVCYIIGVVLWAVTLSEADAAFSGAVLHFDQPRDGTHTFWIEQGMEMGRPSRIRLEIEVKGLAAKTARIGGNAVKIAEGVLTV